jgi:DNA replication protein DnaC
MKDMLHERAKQLGLYGLLSRWEAVRQEPWLPDLIRIEEEERVSRSLERRIRHAKLGTFKPMADFDWSWPEDLERQEVEELFEFKFVKEAANVLLVGGNGLGKTMIAKNLAHQALLKGMSVCFTTAATMLTDLAEQEGSISLARRLKRYCRPQLLVIDEVGYLNYDNRFADLMFEVVTQRYQQRSIIMTTNKDLQDWGSVFPNAACVVTLVDRLVHKAEVIQLEGKSYRHKEALERAEQKQKRRKARKAALSETPN